MTSSKHEADGLSALDRLPDNRKGTLARWRLILGKKAENQGITGQGAQFSGMGGGQCKSGGGSQQQGQQQGMGRRGQRDARAGQRSDRGEQQGEGVTPDGRDQGQQGEGKGQQSSTDAGQRYKALDETLNFVYQTNTGERSAGLSSSGLSIPKWIENVKEFFPNQAKELLEKDLIKKSNIGDLIRHPELFEKVEPSIDMVKTIISLKHMLPENVKAVARKIVEKVVNQLKDQLKTEVERHIIGAIKRDMHTPIKIFRNIDWRQSIRRNLKHYNREKRKLIMAEPRFFSNEKRKKPWQIIVLVDESGSMTDSLIYAVVMASIFTSLPAIRTNLVIFDTRVIDLSDKANDPVDVLMSVQLGGGTDITGAVRYGRSLIKTPKKCIMIVISDFFEGRPAQDLISEFKLVREGETKVIGLAALGSNAKPVYNAPLTKEMNHIGIDVIASTPGNLAELIGRIISS